jgi:two-component system, OmpR family, alkaline phosphatase synthesis response regulator PhoP
MGIAFFCKLIVIILDVMMPDMDGVETCVRMRENTKLNGSLITFLTARNEDYTPKAGFECWRS